MNCIYIQENGICSACGRPALKDCRCPLYRDYEPDICAICHQPIIDFVLFATGDEQYAVVCPNCARRSGTCGLCTGSIHCLLQEYNGPLPQMVMRQFQQNGAIIQAQVPNPEVIAATCHFCGCWDGSACSREFGTCGKYNCVF